MTPAHDSNAGAARKVKMEMEIKISVKHFNRPTVSDVTFIDHSKRSVRMDVGDLKLLILKSDLKRIVKSME